MVKATINRIVIQQVTSSNLLVLAQHMRYDRFYVLMAR